MKLPDLFGQSFNEGFTALGHEIDKPSPPTGVYYTFPIGKPLSNLLVTLYAAWNISTPGYLCFKIVKSPTQPKPNINLFELDTKMTLHTTLPHKLNVSNISVVTAPIMKKL